MRIERMTSLTFAPLLILAAGCSLDETDVQAESAQVTIAQEPVEQVPNAVDVPADQSPSFARLEDCELSEEAASRIRETEGRLSELRTHFTDRHPDVVSTRRSLEALVQAALDSCVEQIQFR